jgi:hypothetical protein
METADPTPDELRRWAYSSAPEPMMDFDVIVAEPDLLPTLLDLVAEPQCPARRYLLGSLYCLVGHSDLGDPRIEAATRQAQVSDDAWLRTWGRRARAVIDHPAARDRAEWCGWSGLRTRPDEETC